MSFTKLSSGRAAPRQYHLLLCIALLCAATRCLAQTGVNGFTVGYVRSNYTKFEYQIPMRDGVKLFTSVYAPKDHTRRYPILMERTPYGVDPYGPDEYRGSLGPSYAFTREGFIFVFQDVRGRWRSEGVFDDPPAHKHTFTGRTDTDESTDSYDTIDWLVKNIPNNNGKVGTWGISYPGFFSAFTLIDAHPALLAASPQAPMADVGNGDDAYHNGAFFLAENFDFYTGFRPKPSTNDQMPPALPRFNKGTPDEYDYFLRAGTLSNLDETVFQHHHEYWTATLQHDTYDKFWADRALGPQMPRVRAAVLVVGGWFDAQDLGGTPKLFHAIDRDGTAPVTLVMGPWSHGSWSFGDGTNLGRLNFKEKTGSFYRDNIELPFFVEHLKGKGTGLTTESDPTMPKAWVFATGSNRWFRFNSWPPTNTIRRSLYLQPGGKLSFRPTLGNDGQFDEYLSDPAKPVPVTGEIVVNLGGDYMTYDQRFASRRPDVLTYESEPLDAPLTIVGPVTPVLRVSTSGTDSDFDVKLIDVYPNDYRDPQAPPGSGRRNAGAGATVPMAGYQQLVRGEPFRGKFRNSLSQPEPFTPDQPVSIKFDMPDVMHTFLPGHRLMVQIQSTWFPLTDRNPQKFMDIPGATESDFQKATERVYRGGTNGSRIDILVFGPDATDVDGR